MKSDFDPENLARNPGIGVICSANGAKNPVLGA